MKSHEYWQKRAEAVANIQHRKAESYVNNALKREYDRARKSIQDEVDSFYVRFSENNEISLGNARKLLSSNELDDFKMTLEEFTALAKNNHDGRWTQKLNNASHKVRVSRIEALMMQIEGNVQALNMAQEEQMASLLTSSYTDTYYRTIYEIQKGIGVGTTFAKIESKQVERIVRTPWLEQNYSERIWGDNARLVRQLETEITQAFIRRDDSRKTAQIIADRMGVGYRNAQRLVRTEMAHLQNEATFKAYRESGVVQKYEFLATLDEKTCKICGPMDGQVFTLAEKQDGVNIAPLHPNCRCDTVPYFDDEIDPGERIARDDEGTYYVSGDMTYEKWKKDHVDSPKSSNNGIIKSDQKFNELLNQTPDISKEYKTHLVERFTAGSSRAQQVFNKYAPANIIKDTTESSAHYNPVSKQINMNLADDLRNPRGAGATFFHEYGHYIDNMAAISLKGKETYEGVSYLGAASIATGALRRAVLEDVDDYIKKYSADKKIDLRQAQQEISQILRQGDGALHSAVSDIFGGATGNRVIGLYGHRADYWKQLPNALESEAFAHIFEASFDQTGKRMELIKEFLPKSLEVFNKILEEI